MTPHAVTPFAKALVAMILSVWAHAAPGIERLPQADEAARAVAYVVVEDAGNAPVFTSHNEDAAVIAYWMYRESTLNDQAVGDGGQSCGVLQQRCAWARDASLVQKARNWLELVRLGKGRCLEHPRSARGPAPATSYAWGACHGLDSTGRVDVAVLAAKREAKARELLQATLRDLAPPDAAP